MKQEPVRVRVDLYPERRWAVGPHCRVPDEHPATAAYKRAANDDHNQIVMFLWHHLKVACGFDEAQCDVSVDEGLNVARWPGHKRTVAHVEEWM